MKEKSSIDFYVSNLFYINGIIIEIVESCFVYMRAPLFTVSLFTHCCCWSNPQDKRKEYQPKRHQNGFHPVYKTCIWELSIKTRFHPVYRFCIWELSTKEAGRLLTPAALLQYLYTNVHEMYRLVDFLLN